jgi:hypothetical protein
MAGYVGATVAHLFFFFTIQWQDTLVQSVAHFTFFYYDPMAGYVGATVAHFIVV